MDAREAREWLKTTKRNAQIEKYREYSDDGLRWEINQFRRKAKPENEYAGARVMAEEKVTWITTAEAAAIMGVELSTVSALCRAKKINCRQHGTGHRSVWEVDKASAMAYKKSVGGRPRKTKL